LEHIVFNILALQGYVIWIKQSDSKNVVGYLKLDYITLHFKMLMRLQYLCMDYILFTQRQWMI